jgi:hypothetical protein
MCKKKNLKEEKQHLSISGIPRNTSRYSSVFQIPGTVPILVQYAMIHCVGEATLIEGV